MEIKKGKLRKVVCSICGRKFTTRHWSKKTCSKPCSRARYLEISAESSRRDWQKNRVVFKRTCKVCGKEFKTTYTNKKTCSDKCGIVNGRKHAIDGYYRLRHTKKYIASNRKSSLKWFKAHQPPLIDYVCAICGDVYQSRFVKRSAVCQKKSCKREAYDRIRREKHEATHPLKKYTCKICGAEFQTRRKNPRMGCSDDCKYELGLLESKRLRKEGLLI